MTLLLRTMPAMLGALLLAVPAGAAPVKPAATAFPPIETCNRLPGAAQFRTALTRAVRARDTAAFVALTAPNVKLDFGDGAGRAELRRRLAGAEGRKLWTELDRILPLGCAAKEGNLVLPSVFEHDFGDVDVFEVMVVTGANVPLRVAPNARARVLRTLSWALAEPVTGDDYGKAFRHVRLGARAPAGYVEKARLRSPLDYRMAVSRRGRTWQIDAFVAGD